MCWLHALRREGPLRTWLRTLVPLTTIVTALLLSPAAIAQGADSKDCDVCPVMVALPGGEFERSAVLGGESFTVSIPPFAIGKFEITVAQYRAFTEATGAGAPTCQKWTTTGYETPRRGGSWKNPFPHVMRPEDDHAVVCSNWDDARAYIGWLNDMTGETYRLPTEAEWEYAARAGLPNNSKWWVLGHMEMNGANCENCTGFDMMGHGLDEGMWEELMMTENVGSFLANGFGLYDLLGNAAEWTEDCFNRSIAESPADGGAATSGDCSHRIVRGGTWHNVWGDLAGWREGLATNRRVNEVGFRVSKTLPGG